MILDPFYAEGPGYAEVVGVVAGQGGERVREVGIIRGFAGMPWVCRRVACSGLGGVPVGVVLARAVSFIVMSACSGGVGYWKSRNTSHNVSASSPSTAL